MSHESVTLPSGAGRRFEEALQQAGLSVEQFRNFLDLLDGPEMEENGHHSLERLFGHFVHDASKPERISIGGHFSEQPRWKVFLAIPSIYLPILIGVIPLTICAFLVRSHLTLVGGHRLKSYWKDFVPAWVTHRYTRENQPVPKGLRKLYWPVARLAQTKLFWLFNCKLYCPLSVALLAYVLYLVKIVEQWWCPFDHDKKPGYANAPIDQSFWHTVGDEELLHPEDRHNPSWNQDARSG